MSPIRVGFIGLSATQSWAVLAHLPFLQQTDLYEIVALCNSSLSSAQASIKAHKLPNSPSAYDKPEDLCADPNVDLVVISTRVDTHYKITKAAILAGKDVFCEWPLTSNHEQVAELAALARGKGVKTMIGLQGQKGATIDKVKEIVDSGRLGDILSVNVAITTDLNFNGPLPPKSAYLVDRAIGGNQLTILTMHTLDSLIRVHGDLNPNYTVHLARLLNTIDLVDPSTKSVVDQIHPTAPDQILLQGIFSSGPVLSYHQQFDTNPRTEPPFRWVIRGTKGEVTVTCPECSMLHFGLPVQIKVHDFKTGSLEEFEYPDAGSEGLDGVAGDVGRLYESYAKGDYKTWEYALERHRMMEDIWSKGGW